MSVIVLILQASLQKIDILQQVLALFFQCFPYMANDGLYIISVTGMEARKEILSVDKNQSKQQPPSPKEIWLKKCPAFERNNRNLEMEISKGHTR